MNSTTETTNVTKYVAYYRVSTRRQNLGLDAQRTQCVNYAHSVGAEIIAEYSEKESGKEDDRKELAKAVTLCEETGAVLLVAKVDRLTRHARYGMELLERPNLRICFASLPEMGDNPNFVAKIMFVIAEHERLAIIDRTNKGLGALRNMIAQGEPRRWGGNPNFGNKAQGIAPTAEGAKILSERAKQMTAQRQETAREDDNNKRAYAYAKSLRATGTRNAQIARDLNTSGFKTPRGKQWTPAGVDRLFKMYNNND